MESVRLVGCSTLLLFILYPQRHHSYTYIKHDLYIEQTEKKWDDASQSCILVGSDRASSYDVIVQDIPFLQPTNRYRPMNLHWIGATATFTPWFKFLGCYIYWPNSSIREQTLTSHSTVIGPVADCYIQCKSHFGVNETHCYCLSNLEQGRLINKTCRVIAPANFRNDVVGTKTLESVFHVYQIAIYEIQNSAFDIAAETLDECLLGNFTHLFMHPCDAADSSNKKWTDAVIDGLPLKDGGQLQWTRYVRRRIIRWTRGNELGSNTPACVSVRKQANEQEYEIVLRPCNDTLPSICQKRDAQKSHQMMTSLPPTSPLMPSDRPAQKGHQMMTSLPPTNPLMPSDRPDVSARGSFREEAPGVPGENPRITYFHSRGSHLGRNGCPRKMERVFFKDKISSEKLMNKN